MMGNKKLQVWLPLLFSFVLIIGMFLGYKLNGGGKGGFFASNRRSSVQEAIDLIRTRYVDSVKVDSLEDKAIEQIMTQLDPHSVYLPPVQLKEANEDLDGKFQGIGVEFNIFNDTVNVVYVIPGGPSEKAGLLPGDKILRVNDSVITGRKFDTDNIKKYIKGPGGSKAVLQVLRGTKQLAITITRGTIVVPSIDAAYMIDKTTAYIKLNKFSDGCYREFMQSLEALKNQGMQNLVFDIRGNGGGFMNEAVEMADEFLDGEKLVVYLQGVNTKKREYRCKRPGLLEKGKLILLVDELSASASEVLAGALQDWCRATVIGRRTFGKGLVQEQYSLSDGAAIRLTIARYYTPLGRSIQRSYANGKKIYMDDLWDRYKSGEMFSEDSVRRHNNGKVYQNTCGKPLYGGDGITPDIFVPIDTTIVYDHINSLIGSSILNQYLYSYYFSHKQDFDRFKTLNEYVTGFSPNGLLAGFEKKLVADTSLKTAPLSAREKQMLELRMKGLLARYKWSNPGYYQVINTDDPVMRKALETIAQ
ncbi:MAG: S41 family peptidase [Chitinophagaceae bacterium]